MEYVEHVHPLLDGNEGPVVIIPDYVVEHDLPAAYQHVLDRLSHHLLLRLVQGGDQNESILACYGDCLDRLVADRNSAQALRRFELELLDLLGYRVDLETDFRTGEPIAPDRQYIFEHEGGLTASAEHSTMEHYSGRHLIELREQRLSDVESLRAARQLLGGILQVHLGERPLKTRLVMREIRESGLRGQ
jgi:DNA repair protein RecO (recombination protein O)